MNFCHKQSGPGDKRSRQILRALIQLKKTLHARKHDQEYRGPRIKPKNILFDINSEGNNNEDEDDITDDEEL